MLIDILLYVVLPYLICYLIASRVTRRYSLQNVSAQSAGFGGFFMSSSEVLGGRFFATLGLALVFYGILALIYFAVRPTPAEEEKSEEESSTSTSASPPAMPSRPTATISVPPRPSPRATSTPLMPMPSPARSGPTPLTR